MHKRKLQFLALALTAVVSAPAPAQSPAAPLVAPDEGTIPQSPLGDAIRRGKTLLTDTRRQLPRNVGNGLNCSSCHLNAGTTAYASPWVGLAGVFPE